MIDSSSLLISLPLLLHIIINNGPNQFMITLQLIILSIKQHLANKSPLTRHENFHILIFYIIFQSWSSLLEGKSLEIFIFFEGLSIGSRFILVAFKLSAMSSYINLNYEN